ncbi:DNA gyrase subunit A [Candidatus Allofournierella excrementigallinarum]|uniref:DNA gyrase subunit A n=1 Tax=Candidatus Allofournierella excrementigallinarum TaxID=2838592 RepID=UPI00374F9BB7
MNEDFVMIPGTGTKLIVRDVKDEIESAFLDYSMSVIVSRALPDVRDGLKPVHRRILYTMHERGNDPQHPYRKSADTVGAVLGSYHPHGDASVYDAMVRLAQDFSMRYPLVDGQGNFGSVDGDPPAAYRYTEARMSRMAMELLTDIDKDTVDFGPNFDETKKEPTVLPSRFPNLLVNGSTGIAVGMATNIPPHNLGEVIDGAVALIQDPDIDLAGLMEHIKGPDFPTGGVIMGRSGIRAAYATGKGKITLRGRAEIEEKKNGRFQIIVTEIPYMVNKARLIESIADLVKDKRIEGISDLNDESNRHGMRIVIELKKEANPQVVLNQLYRYTQLQDTVGVNLLALDGGVPKVMSLKTMLERYVQFQDQVIRRRTQFDLNKARERAHILEGLARAVDIVDDVIYAIRHCGGGQAEAKAAIMEKFGFDEPQADAICKFPLGRLAGLEILKIENELDELHKKIADWTAILADDARVLAIVTEELLALKEKYGDERRTEIAHVSGEVDIEDLIPVEECVFTLTHAGYIKRQSKDTYQVQRRGGRGISGLSHKDEDFVEELFIGSTHDYVLFVTDQGRVYRLKGYQIYEGSRTSKGTNIVNLLPLQNGENVIRMVCMPAEKAEGFLTMVTKRGLIKRTPIEAYSNIRKSGLLAVSLYEGDSLAWCRITSGSDELLLATRDGMAIRFDERSARQMGRMGHGVRAVRLAQGDEVVGVGILRPGATVFTVTESGKGRRSRVDDYRLQSRGGKGIRNYAKGGVAGIKILDEEDDVILISQEGIIIRMHAEDINVQSRYGSGVRVMRLAQGDRVVTVARTERSDEAPVEKPEDEPEEALTDEELAALAAEDAAADEEAEDGEGGEE